MQSYEPVPGAATKCLYHWLLVLQAWFQISMLLRGERTGLPSDVESLTPIPVGEGFYKLLQADIKS